MLDKLNWRTGLVSDILPSEAYRLLPNAPPTKGRIVDNSLLLISKAQNLPVSPSPEESKYREYQHLCPEGRWFWESTKKLDAPVVAIVSMSPIN